MRSIQSGFWFRLFDHHALSKGGMAAAMAAGLWLASTHTGLAQTNKVEPRLVPPTNSLAAADITNGLGSWIWASNTVDNQTCQFWRSFEVPSTSAVIHAQLRMTV